MASLENQSEGGFKITPAEIQRTPYLNEIVTASFSDRLQKIIVPEVLLVARRFLDTLRNSNK